TGNHDGLAAVFGVERMCFLDLLVFYELSAEKLEFGNLHPESFSDGIVEGIAGYRCNQQDDDHQPNIQLVGLGGKHSCGEQQGVSRKEGHYHDSCLDENNQKEDEVRPRFVI